MDTDASSAVTPSRSTPIAQDDTVLQGAAAASPSRSRQISVDDSSGARNTTAIMTAIHNNQHTGEIVSYNMHEFLQGCPVLDDMINRFNSDVFLLQEHWLIPANLYKFDKHFEGFFSVGCSATSTAVETDMLRRPFGGVMSLINNVTFATVNSLSHGTHG